MPEIEKTKIELPQMNIIIPGWAKVKGRSLRKLSRMMGKGENYLQQNIRNNDVRPSLLLELSRKLTINLFEYYLVLLPTNVQETEREKKLQREIESLKKELEEVKKERDRYWEVIGKR